MSEQVTVVGVTSWGLALAQLFALAGSSVTLLARNEEEAATVRLQRTDPARIKEVRLPSTVDITPNLEHAAPAGAIVVFAVPSQTVRRNAVHIAPHIPASAILVSAAKGIELESGLRMTEVLASAVPGALAYCALSGPNLAGEIARGLPATTVVAGPDAACERVQRALSADNFRVYTHDDVVGVELGGALKNIIALAAGIADGLESGDNAKAALITRGLAEITRLGVALGANPMTFAGLSGLGDVIATCASRLSRNHRVGEELARGRPLGEILAGLGHVAEGVTTTGAACVLAERHGVEMPITAGIARILRGELSPPQCARLLFDREPRAELDRF
jgi:glycerol-3-phosphate dehydrogenase (NAD(P)+)